jgi:hypothetical protein
MPEETAPRTTPSRNGVRRLEAAKSVPHPAALRSRCRWYAWKAKADPRRTIPARTRVTGRNRAVERRAYAPGNPVNRTTTATMTQIWFVSQTGPMA